MILSHYVRCNDANDDGDENVDGDNDTDIEEDLPQYSDYQHNFIEGGGLKVRSVGLFVQFRGGFSFRFPPRVCQR